MRTFQEYVAQVTHQIAASGLTTEWSKISQIQKSRNSGKVRALDIMLINGALFSFTEDVRIENGQPMRLKYSYRYEHQGYKFRYDKDPSHIVPFSHEECHLHAINEEPRYKTHETNLEEILNFVEACFINDNSGSE